MPSSCPRAVISARVRCLSSFTMPKTGTESPFSAKACSATAACCRPPSIKIRSGSGQNFSSPSKYRWSRRPKISSMAP